MLNANDADDDDDYAFKISSPYETSTDGNDVVGGSRGNSRYCVQQHKVLISSVNYIHTFTRTHMQARLILYMMTIQIKFNFCFVVIIIFVF